MYRKEKYSSARVWISVGVQHHNNSIYEQIISSHQKDIAKIKVHILIKICYILTNGSDYQYAMMGTDPILF